MANPFHESRSVFMAIQAIWNIALETGPNLYAGQVIVEPNREFVVCERNGGREGREQEEQHTLHDPIMAELPVKIVSIRSLLNTFGRAHWVGTAQSI